MSRLCVIPIVEGYGEVESIRILLERLWYDLGGEYIDVLRPYRQPRTKLGKPDLLRQAVEAAGVILRHHASPDPGLILVLVDRDPDTEPPCVLGPQWLNAARGTREDISVACVFANLEYETWFVAAAESLPGFLDLQGEQVPDDPEKQGCDKGWVQRHYKGPGRSYSEPVDQPAMTHTMDLTLCRKRSPSFDKLCRELEKRIRTTSS